MLKRAGQLIEQGAKLAEELEHLRYQYDAALETDRLDINLSPASREEGARKHRGTVRRRVQQARESFIDEASKLLPQLAPTPAPPATKDPLTRYQREHELFSMSAEDRSKAFRDAVKSSDSLTYSVVMAAAKEKPWLPLVSDVDLWQVEKYWTDKHTPHESWEYQRLGEVLHRVNRAVANLTACSAEPQAV